MASLAVEITELKRALKLYDDYTRQGVLEQMHFRDLFRLVDRLKIPFETSYITNIRSNIEKNEANFQRKKPISFGYAIQATGLLLNEYKQYLKHQIRRKQGEDIPRKGDRRIFKVNIAGDVRDVEFEFKREDSGSLYWISIDLVALAKFPTGNKVWPSRIELSTSSNPDNRTQYQKMRAYHLNSNRSKIILWNDPKYDEYLSHHGLQRIQEK